MTIAKAAQSMLFSGLATLAMVAQASALDAGAFIDRLTAVYNRTDIALTFGAAQLSSDTITVDGVTVVRTAQDGSTYAMHFDTPITFSGVSERDNGDYYAESVTIPDIDTEATKEMRAALSVRDVRITSLVVPGHMGPEAAMIRLYGSASTGAFSLVHDGIQVIGYDRFEAGSTFEQESDLSIKLSINGLALDLSKIGSYDPPTGAMVEALGLTHIAGDISHRATWSPADGHMTIHQFMFDFVDLGALDIHAELNGLTADVLTQIDALQDTIAAREEMSESEFQAQFVSGISAVSAVEVVGASVRYEDASLAGSLLDFFAERSGADRATFVAGLKSMLAAFVGQTGIQALTDVAVPPVQAFLDKPESLEIRLSPTTPAELLILAAMATNPAAVIEYVGLAVLANEPLD